MFEYPDIPYGPQEARARELRAEAAHTFFARLVAFFRDTKACNDCGKPVVIS